VAGVSCPALSSQSNECPVGACGRYETALRPSFAGQIFRRNARTSRSALALRAEVFRIRLVSLSGRNPQYRYLESDVSADVSAHELLRQCGLIVRLGDMLERLAQGAAVSWRVVNTAQLRG
jgi:hypothetical protein